MAKRKYISEFALNMHMTHDMLLQQEDLKRVPEFNYFDDENPCHIYFICRRPRILIDPDKFHADDNKVIFTFKIQKQSQYESLNIQIPNKFGTIDLKLTASYPYNTFELRRKGEVILFGKTAVLLQHFGTSYSDYLDLEVLYIGQSYGVEGARTAPDRLQSHSTLQGIYSEAIQRNPNCEIWLLLASFEQILLTSIDGRIVVNDEDLVHDDKHLKKITKTVLLDGMDEQQVINFTEAALIRYFEPPYNKEYKNTFPNPAHSTYTQCYDLDINSVCIELDTQDIYCKLFSESVSPQWWHMKDFLLHSKEERKSMFEI